MNIDTTTAIGTMMLNIFASVAQFERDQMLVRQRVGIEAAKLADKGKPLEGDVRRDKADRTSQSCKRARLARSRP